MARESPLQSGFKSHSHKRRSVRFNGLWRVTQATSAPNRTHSGSQGETGAFRAGGITTLGPFCAVRKPCAAGYQNGVLCRFWVLVGGAPKERREPRDSDALMRVAVPRRRGPAGLRIHMPQIYQFSQPNSSPKVKRQARKAIL